MPGPIASRGRGKQLTGCKQRHDMGIKNILLKKDYFSFSVEDKLGCDNTTGQKPS